MERNDYELLECTLTNKTLALYASKSLSYNQAWTYYTVDGIDQRTYLVVVDSAATVP